MVLSNKKLKQKLRAAKAECLTVTESGASHPTREESTNTDPTNSELQMLLVATRKRRKLSKREKRRNSQSLLGLDSKGKRINADESEENKKSEGGEENGSEEKKEKKKKRKREGEGAGKALSERKGGGVYEVKKAKKKKKKKKSIKSDNKKVGDVDGNGDVKEAAEGVSESQMNDDSSRKVYVGGIPYYSTEDDIRSYFESCGTITIVDCMTFYDSGKFRGIAIITFKTEAAAKRALALDGADMGGFFLKIQPYKTRGANKVPDFAPKIVEGYNRIYIGNLSWDITEEDLRKFFSDCNISSIRFGMDKETGEFQGYAHVDFSDNLSLMMALKMDQQVVCGRPIKISCAVHKKGEKNPSTTMSTTVSTSYGANDGGLSTSSGKIKRRKCYECGEKGHTYSACPKKPTAVPINSNAS